MTTVTGEGYATVVLEVEGMTCQACERHVGDALATVPGVSEVEVQQATGTATIRIAVAGAAGTATAEETVVAALVDAVRDAGYDANLARLSAAPMPEATAGPAPARCHCCEVSA